MKKIFMLGAAAMVAMSANAQIFFMVEKPGNDKASYILGTHHFAPLSAIDEIEELAPALASVETVYGELDMRDAQNPNAMMGCMQVMMAPNDSTITKLLNKEEMAQLRKLWEYYVPGGAQLDMLAGMKPAMISTTLAAMMSQSEVKKEVPEVSDGIDMTMQTRALEQGKAVKGLEDMCFQMEMLYGTPISKQMKDLRELIYDGETKAKEAVELTKAYEAHNLDAIMKYMEKDCESEAEMEKMIYSRNDDWISQLSKVLPNQSVMVVVGAGHLPGERGLLEGLRKAGYTVTPIK